MSNSSNDKFHNISNIGKSSILIAVFFIALLLISDSCKKTEEEVLFDFCARFSEARAITPYKSQNLFRAWSEGDRMFGWNRNRKLEPNAILIPRQKEKAFFSFGCLEKRDTKLAFNIRSLLTERLDPTPVFDVSLNGHKIFASSLDQREYQRVVINAKKEYLHIGENILEFRRSAIPESIKDRHWLALRQFVFGRQRPESPDQIEAKEHSFLDMEKQRIAIDMNTCLSYPVKIPRQAKFAFDIGFQSAERSSLDGSKIVVYLESLYGEDHILYEQSFTGRTGVDKKKLPVDLSPYEDLIARISFVFMSESRAVDPSTRLFLENPRIFKKEDPPSPEAEEDDPDLPESFNILVYLVDCFRPDFLPFFGYKKNIAPHMSEFAKDCVLFENAYAQSSWTRPSVGALFTGLYPFQHQAISLKSGLAADLQTLAEILKEAGFRTIGISSNAGIKEFFNFNQGFDYFKYHSNLDGGLAETLNTYAFAQLSMDPSPFFMYIHTMELHRPYHVKEEFYPTAPVKPNIVVVEKRGEERYTVDLNHTLLMYEASITQNDKAFGDLMAELKRLRLYDKTLIILMSDHGEEFYEHGGFAHGQTLYQEQVKHLFIVKLPHELNGGRRIIDNVQEIDIFPTLLDLAGEDVPAYLSGKSLKRLLLSPDSVDSPVHPEIFLETGPNLDKKAIVDGKWKLIHTGMEWTDDIREYELYALESDPGERTDLFGRNPIAARYLKTRLFNWVKAQKKLEAIGKEDIEKTLTEKEIEELRALGYIK
ncbi:MAG: sulfatase [Candidatus Aminicenantes bacterium]